MTLGATKKFVLQLIVRSFCAKPSDSYFCGASVAKHRPAPRLTCIVDALYEVAHFDVPPVFGEGGEQGVVDLRHTTETHGDKFRHA